MSEWMVSGYKGLAYLGERETPDYRGYVVLTDRRGPLSVETWFVYAWNSSGEYHDWIGRADSYEAACAILEAHPTPRVNLHKHTCVACGATANVETDDGFVKVAHCVPCTRRGMVRAHIRKYFATVTPLAQVQGCPGGCK